MVNLQKPILNTSAGKDVHNCSGCPAAVKVGVQYTGGVFHGLLSQAKLDNWRVNALVPRRHDLFHLTQGMAGV